MGPDRVLPQEGIVKKASFGPKKLNELMPDQDDDGDIITLQLRINGFIPTPIGLGSRSSCKKNASGASQPDSTPGVILETEMADYGDEDGAGADAGSELFKSFGR